MPIKKFGSVHFIKGGNNGFYPYSHSIFIDSERPLLIDTASDREVLLELKNKHPDMPVAMSHFHEDHFLFYNMFKDHPLWISAEDAPAIESIDGLMRLSGVTEPDKIAMWSNTLRTEFNYYERNVDVRFNDGDVFDLGRASVSVIALPGHTKGHCGFFIEPDGVLFIADMALTPFGAWYAHECSSIEDTLESIEKVKSIQANVYITSHLKGVFENIDKELEDFRQSIFLREEKILSFLELPRTIEDITDQWIIIQNPREEWVFARFYENNMIQKHLDRLIKAGDVEDCGGHYVKK